MKVIGKEKKPMYCDETLVDYYTIYIVDKLPKEEQYIDVDNKKGYVVSIQEDEVQDVKWVSIPEFESMIESGIVSSTSYFLFKEYYNN